MRSEVEVQTQLDKLGAEVAKARVEYFESKGNPEYGEGYQRLLQNRYYRAKAKYGLLQWVMGEVDDPEVIVTLQATTSEIQEVGGNDSEANV